MCRFIFSFFFFCVLKDNDKKEEIIFSFSFLHHRISFTDKLNLNLMFSHNMQMCFAHYLSLYILKVAASDVSNDFRKKKIKVAKKYIKYRYIKKWSNIRWRELKQPLNVHYLKFVETINTMLAAMNWSVFTNWFTLKWTQLQWFRKKKHWRFFFSFVKNVPYLHLSLNYDDCQVNEMTSNWELELKSKGSLRTIVRQQKKKKKKTNQHRKWYSFRFNFVRAHKEVLHGSIVNTKRIKANRVNEIEISWIKLTKYLNSNRINCKPQRDINVDPRFDCP